MSSCKWCGGELRHDDLGYVDSSTSERKRTFETGNVPHPYKKRRRRTASPGYTTTARAQSKGEVEYSATADMLYRRARSTQVLRPPFECTASGALRMRTQRVNSEKIKLKNVSNPCVCSIGDWEANLSLSQDFGSPKDISSHFASGVWSLLKVVQERAKREDDIL
ncbi:hypothetical protein E6O75_ATG07893 [Venturia nashicola]|uniref:Uncharacterized protein n=1 Tax=Venturia nashicola TaxID=86259 RepID=A0A4Z1NJ01_9PEZI|nr:hypothetical protein E6O75_ATG07893 [Venturia nashicola]